jgi:hypothetical protein
VNRRVRLAAGFLGGAVIAVAVGLAVLAQPSGNQTSSGPDAATAAPPGVPIIEPPPETSDNAASNETPPHASSHATAATNSLAPKPAPAPPPVPPKPVRSPSAVLQALDKVTAETLRFAVPLGQAVRYKNLVFTVKVCETSGLGTASPLSSAYVVIDFAPLAAEGIPAPPPRRVYKGWMFANSPGLNPFQHPTYDAWLVTCIASTPPA